MTTGEGGMILTDDEYRAQKMRKLRNLGKNSSNLWEENETHRLSGFNMKMSDISSAIGIEQLKKLDSMIAERSKIYDKYFEALSDFDSTVIGIQTDVSSDGKGKTNYQSCVIRLVDPDVRDRKLNILRKKGIEVQIGSYDLSHGTLDISRQLALSTMALPIWPGMTDEMINEVVSELLAK
jgi:dTDP-4-amino-4,6-dideoxygalactose transaminase